jgi:hypothetical protein
MGHYLAGNLVDMKDCLKVDLMAVRMAVPLDHMMVVTRVLLKVV